MSGPPPTKSARVSVHGSLAARAPHVTGAPRALHTAPAPPPPPPPLPPPGIDTQDVVDLLGLGILDRWSDDVRADRKDATFNKLCINLGAWGVSQRLTCSEHVWCSACTAFGISTVESRDFLWAAFRATLQTPTMESFLTKPRWRRHLPTNWMAHAPHPMRIFKDADPRPWRRCFFLISYTLRWVATVGYYADEVQPLLRGWLALPNKHPNFRVLLYQDFCCGGARKDGWDKPASYVKLILYASIGADREAIMEKVIKDGKAFVTLLEAAREQDRPQHWLTAQIREMKRHNGYLQDEKEALFQRHFYGGYSCFHIARETASGGRQEGLYYRPRLITLLATGFVEVLREFKHWSLMGQAERVNTTFFSREVSRLIGQTYEEDTRVTPLLYGIAALGAHRTFGDNKLRFWSVVFELLTWEAVDVRVTDHLGRNALHYLLAVSVCKQDMLFPSSNAGQQIIRDWVGMVCAVVQKLLDRGASLTQRAMLADMNASVTPLEYLRASSNGFAAGCGHNFALLESLLDSR